MKKIIGGLVVLSMLLTTSVFALDISFINKNIWLSKDQNVSLGETVTIYSMVVNNEPKNIGGEMMFLDTKTNQQVGNVVSFSLPGQGTSQVLSTQWVAVKGNHQFKAKVLNAYEIVDGKKQLADINLSSATTSIVYIDFDEDNDGWLNLREGQEGTDPKNSDTDGDTLKDSIDPNPLKKDADGDGDPDNTDPEPLNPDVKTEPDTDGDGIPDPEDSDKDNDGLYNWEEAEKGTDELKYDTDRDGVNDRDDAYPTDPNKTEVEVATLPKEQQENSVQENNTDNNEAQNEPGDASAIPDANVVEEIENFLNNTELDGQDDSEVKSKTIDGLEVVDSSKSSSKYPEDPYYNMESGSSMKSVLGIIIAIILIVGVIIGIKKSKE